MFCDGVLERKRAFTPYCINALRCGRAIRQPPGVQLSRDAAQQEELAQYRRAALARISSPELEPDHVAWDERRGQLNGVYEANLNGARKRPCEIVRFDPAGRQIRGEARHGAIICRAVRID